MYCHKVSCSKIDITSFAVAYVIVPSGYLQRELSWIPGHSVVFFILVIKYIPVETGCSSTLAWLIWEGLGEIWREGGR